jgi:nicotinamidase-related amidase
LGGENMMIQAELSQLLLVDWQPRLIAALHDGQAALANAIRLATAAQRLQVPVWGTEQNPSKLGELVPDLRGRCQQTLAKMRFSAASPQLQSCLMPRPAGNARSLPRHLVVISGCEAHVCVLQTALDLLEQEQWGVWLVTDACASRTERNRDAAYDRLASAGAELVSTEMVLFEWLGTADHPEFKAVQALIR